VALVYLAGICKKGEGVLVRANQATFKFLRSSGGSQEHCPTLTTDVSQPTAKLPDIALSKTKVRHAAPLKNKPPQGRFNLERA
jgi:hypothetical protein